MSSEHIPVLLQEVIQGLDPKPNENFIDATVGLGGHSGEILRRISPHGRLLGFDKDPNALKIAEKNLSEFKGRFELINDNFKNIGKYEHPALSEINGILCDLGLSGLQIASGSARGFSFKEPQGPLDMRMDPSGPETAADILNGYPEKKLAQIFREYGEERYSREVANKIIAKRKIKKFEQVGDLLEVIDSTYKNKPKPKKIHPATKVFQALRIAVNHELDDLEEFLPIALKALAPNGRLAVISFHSLEDRIVKDYFRQESKDCLCPPQFPQCVCGHKPQLKIVTKKPVVPSAKEIAENPRARSAKLRIIEKI